MAHLRKSVNMYFKKMNPNVGKYADQVWILFSNLFKSMAMHVNDFETKEDKI